MKSSLNDEIRERLRRYLTGEIALQEFEDWFTANTWNIHQVGDPATMDLAYEIDLRLPEHTNGDGTEDDLKLVLREGEPTQTTSSGRAFGFPHS